MRRHTRFSDQGIQAIVAAATLKSQVIFRTRCLPDKARDSCGRSWRRSALAIQISDWLGPVEIETSRRREYFDGDETPAALKRERMRPVKERREMGEIVEREWPR